MAQTKIQSAQLSDSGVVPGPYTSANLTVDASGRVTAASNGASVPALTSTQVAYGSSLNTITSTADFTYDDITGTLEVGPVGSDALIEANVGQAIVVSGDTGARFESNSNTFGINSSGAVLVNSSAGTAGQVLTSAGASAPPTWAAAGGGISEPDTQLVYGTGSGVSSSDLLTYEVASGKFFVNQTANPLPFGSVYIYSGANNTSDGYSGLELQQAGASGSSGVFMFAGDGEYGGAMEIAAGSGTTSGGGSTYIYSGDGSSSGEILIRTGIADNGNGGGIFLRCQSSSDAGGIIQLDAGNASAGPGGDIEILAGDSDNNPGIDPGGTIYITAGNTISGTTGVGGNVNITAGRNFITPAYSGDITFTTENTLRLTISKTGEFVVGGTAGTSGQVLTSQGSGTPPVWSTPAAGGGLEMNVFVMTGGSGQFDGTLLNNYTSVVQRDESPTLLWDPDTYGGNYTCLVNGVYEIVVECRIIGDDGFGVWPSGDSSYGVDLFADYPALNATPQTKLHTRYSSDAAGLATAPAPVGEAGSTVSFTERFIVRSDVGGIVYPKMFAFNYVSSAPSVSCSMSISFMKISDYTPA